MAYILQCTGTIHRS
ncbi:Protein of unknown function [Pyronema omphalodes CBS 100304]|uniref:Uncharacterized protein n=1 Tax=Pyronema omphalodes (strain CBS 100304) TaxID=1076935 RepID=U4L6Q0_PYROM|nr:Protein of unknown function [Pyronema omphalodes CBS 100304]